MAYLNVMKRRVVIALAYNGRFYAKTTFNSMTQNSLMSIASILTVACCLFLFGVFLLFTVNVNYLSYQLQAQCEIQAFIASELDDAAANNVYTEISKMPGVKKAVFESKATAMKNYMKTLGGNAVAFEGLEDGGFLRNSIKITLVDIKQARQLEAELKKINGVAQVKNRQDIVDNIVKITDYIKNSSLIVMIILTLVSLFIISNTIKLSVNSRANEIHIMKYVGGTDWFIRWPFVIEGILVGIIGGLISILLLMFGYNSLIKSMAGFLDMFKILSFGELALPIITLILIFGSVMGAGGSIIAIRRHLKV